MKNILVPTDFSDASKNAINYAISLAIQTNASITLLHVYHVPVVTTEVAMAMPSLKEIEDGCLNRLKEIKNSLLLTYGASISIHIKCECGLAVDEIQLYVKDNAVDLVVMGIKGAGILIEKIFGSTTTSLINQATFPVLVIDEAVRFKPLSKIALACDYLEMDKTEHIKVLKQLVEVFKSHVDVLHIVNELEPANIPNETVTNFMKVENSLSNIDHTFHSIENNDVIDGINTFLSERNIDMIVMMPRKHNFFENMLHESHTKRMAFHTKVPLLTLPG